MASAIQGSTTSQLERTTRTFRVSPPSGYTTVWSIRGDGSIPANSIRTSVVVTAGSVTSSGGSYTLSVTCISSGSIPDIQNDSVTVTVRDSTSRNRNPTLSVKADNDRIKVNGSTTVRAVADDPDGDTLRYVWNHSGVGSAAINSGTTRQTVVPISAGPRAGRLNIRCRVFDDRGGTANVLETIDVVANQKPTGSISLSATSAKEGGSISANISASDSDGSVTNYAWSATGGTVRGVGGDGTSGSKAVAVIWDAPSSISGTSATYTISCVITDNDGATTTVRRTVTVTKAVPEPTSFTLSIASTISEGSSVPITIRLDVAATESMSFSLSAVSAGTTAASSDYSIPSSITINKGNQSGQGTFQAVDDTSEEGSETVQIRASRAGFTSRTRTITILANDANDPPSGRVSLSPEGPVGFGDPVSCSFIGSDPDGGVLKYLWTATGGRFTINPVADLGTTDSTAVWNAPNSAGTYTIRCRVTDDEGAAVTFSKSIKVEDTSPPPTSFRLGSPTLIVDEGKFTNILAILNSVATSNVTLTVSVVAGGTTAASSEYSVAGTISIPTGQIRGTARFTANTDGIQDGDKIVNISVSHSSLTSDEDSVSITIRDVDTTPNARPTVSISGPTTIGLGEAARLFASASDSDGRIAAYRWSVTRLSGTRDGSFNSFIGITGDLAAFEAPNSAGSHRIKCVVTDDDGAIAEDTHDIVVSQSGRTTLTLSGSDVVEGQSTTITATLNRAAPSGGYSVALSYSGGAIRNTDYRAPSSLSIPSGATSATFAITTVANDRNNNLKEIRVVATISSILVTSNTLIVDIVDSVPDPTLLRIIADDSINPGETKSVVLETDNNAKSDLVVNLSFSGKAVRATDYHLSASAIIKSGSNSASINLFAVDDEDDEDEDIVISARIARPSLSASKTITIKGKTEEISEITLSAPSVVREGESITLVIETDKEAPEDGAVIVLSASGTATENADYNFPQKQVTILEGQKRATVRIQTLNDEVNEPVDETIIVNAVLQDSSPSISDSITISITERGSGVIPVPGTDFFCVIPDSKYNFDLSVPSPELVAFPNELVPYIEGNDIVLSTFGRVNHENDEVGKFIAERGNLRATGLLRIGPVSDHNLGLKIEAFISEMSRPSRYSDLSLYRKSFSEEASGAIVAKVLGAESLITHKLSAAVGLSKIKVGDYARVFDTKGNRLMQVIGRPESVATDIIEPEPEPEPTSVWGDGISTPSGVNLVGLFVDPDDNVIGIAGNNVYSWNGTAWSTLFTANFFFTVNSIVLTPSDGYYIGAGRFIFRRRSSSLDAFTAPSGEGNVVGLTVDSSGTVYALGNDTKKIYSRSSGSWSEHLAVPNTFGALRGLSVNSEGHFAVIEGNNIKIYNGSTWDSGPSIPAGTGDRPFNGIAYDSDGNLYISSSSGKVYTNRPPDPVTPTTPDVVEGSSPYVILSPNIALPVGSFLFSTETVKARLDLERLPVLSRNADWYGPWNIPWIEIK